MADLTHPPLSIHEQGGPSVAIVLEEHDAPHGQARAETAWQEGGELKLGDDEGSYFPGRSQPTYFPLYWKPAPRSVHGAFRDSLWGEKGHSKKLCDDLEALAKRGNLVNVYWGDESFLGLLKKVQLDREDEGDYKYELTFLVAEVGGQETTDSAQAENPRTSEPLTDVIGQLEAQRAEMAAKLAALRIEATTYDAIITAQQAVESAFLPVTEGARALELSTVGKGRQLVGLAQRLDARCAEAQAAVVNLAVQVQALDAAAVAIDRNASAVVGIMGVQADVSLTLLYMRSRLRQIRAEALGRVQESAILYRVKPGDTLTDIAGEQLGSRAKGYDLGVRDSELVDGALIQLPEV